MSNDVDILNDISLTNASFKNKREIRFLLIGMMRRLIGISGDKNSGFTNID
jgi:hypothetical protein